jgi:hypothetical protein
MNDEPLRSPGGACSERDGEPENSVTAGFQRAGSGSDACRESLRPPSHLAANSGNELDYIYLDYIYKA